MAVTCPTLTSVLNADQCNENYAGVAQTAYFFVKSDLSAALTESDGVYSTPAFASGKGLYKVDCKEESNKIEGGSLGYRKGFKLTATIVAELVNKATAKLGRAINNLDIGIIIKDGDLSQILYDPDHKIKFDADGIKTDTGAAAADDRTTTLSATLQPVKYPNLYVEEPAAGWDSLLATGASEGSVATPVITIADGKATIAESTSGAVVFYTTDGTDPTVSPEATKYSSAVTLTSGQTIKAVALKGSTWSNVASKTYTA